MLEQWIEWEAFSSVIVLGGWMIRLGALIIIPFRRDPLAAKGWLVLIFFMPYIGLLTFLLLGRVLVSEAYRKKILEYPTLAAARSSFLKEFEVREFPDTPGNSVIIRAEYVKSLGPFSPLSGNQVEVLADYNETLMRIEAAIHQARHHVHLAFYIFFKDKSTEGIISALQMAAKRNVECRVLLDAYGCKSSWDDLVNDLEPYGVIMNEMNSLRNPFRKVARFDVRNHEKILVVDGQVAFTGSQNLVQRVAQSGVVYDDLMVCLRGPIVAQVQTLFLAEWYAHVEELITDSRYFPVPKIDEGQVISSVVPSGPVYETQYHHRLIVELIYASRRHIGVTTPYFIPDPALLQALQSAVLRGVHVDLMISEKTDNDFVDCAQRSYFEELLEWGVNIHHYPERFLHSKFLTFDDTVAFVGTTNMDIRSFQLNSELGVLIHNTEVTRELRGLEKKQIQKSRVLDLDSWRERPLMNQFFENLARLFSSLL